MTVQMQTQLREELRKILSEYCVPKFANDIVEKFEAKMEEIFSNHGVSANQGANLLENKYNALADKFVQFREQLTKKTTDIIKATMSLQTEYPGGNLKWATTTGAHKNSTEYVHISPLGNGAFGSVWCSYDRREKTIVATKFVDFTDIKASDQKSNKDICEREFNILWNLEPHRNIVKILDGGGLDGNKAFLVLEFCSGPTLYQFVQKNYQNNFMEEDDAFFVFNEILNGLHHLHTKKIVHYDLHPGNVLLNTNKLEDGLKITDFGLSKQLMGLSSKPNSTPYRGSPLYYPPELLSPSSKTVSDYVDIWSLGCIYFEILFKKRPFGNDVDHNKVFEHIDKTPIKEDRFYMKQLVFPSNPVTDERTQQLIKSCLEKDVKNRAKSHQLKTWIENGFPSSSIPGSSSEEQMSFS